MLSNAEREKLVLDLYYNQRKNVRQIAQEARISFRDITAILKKVNNDVGNGNGIGVDNQQQQQQSDDSNNKSPNEKATNAYKLFSEGKKPVQVAIELGLREKQVDKLYREFWKLKRIDKLYRLYPEIEHCLPSFLKLHRVLKKNGLNPDNIEWFADAIEIGAVKLPEIQNEYAKIKNELQAIDYKKTMAKYELQNINNQIAILNRDAYNKRNEIAYLHYAVQELEEYLRGLKNHIQQQPLS